MTMKMNSFCRRSTFVLTGISWLGSLCLMIALCGSPAHAQGTFTAASCNRSDVNAVINGPTHTAVDGDTINIPAGSCTWNTGIKISGVGISIIGAGNPNVGSEATGAGSSVTTITDAINDGATPLFNIQSVPYRGNSTPQLMRMS